MEENLIRKQVFNHISNLINSGANIIDVGGESTRPGSKTVKDKIEWNRVKFVIKISKKNTVILPFQLIRGNLLLLLTVLKMELI